MQNIPIIGQGKHGPEIQTIRTSDILHIERISHHAYKLHTTDNAVILNITLETLQEWLYEDGFRLIDRNHLVNIHHIQDFDTQKGKVFFGDPQLPATKSAPLARSQYKHLEALLQLMGTHTELSIEEAASAIQASLDPNSAPEFERSYRTFLEVAERQRAENQIRYMAYHDALTGLPNRLKLRESMLEAFEQAQRSGKRVAVFFLDLDRLKVINDTLGHHVGDLLLKYWAASFESLIAKHGMVARFSGDEFIMLLPNVNDLEFVQMMADDVIRLFRTPFLYMKQELYSTASIGIAMYPKDGEDPDTLLKYTSVASKLTKKVIFYN